MTAVISIVQSDAVHFLTDGVAFDYDGSSSPIQKAVAIAHMPAIIAVRGPAALATLAGAELSMCASFDDLCAQLVAMLHRIERSAEAWLKASAGGVSWDIYVAGRRKREGWRAYMVCNHFRYGVDPFSLTEMPGVSYAPTYGAVDEAFGEISAGLSPDDFNPATHGLRLMLAQRAAGGPTFAGGFCQWTMASEGGCRTRILQRWPNDFRGALT
ncbi:hypothetical protein V5F63_08170 [Xanthobacter autotrophicus DSM 597]|uniref:hypothetical protein n=1 Tax=Xanthobacter wiegelii TaxID=3119913 RepID=UPI003729DEED